MPLTADNRIRVDVTGADELVDGLADIREEFPERFTNEGGIHVEFVRGTGRGLTIHSPGSTSPEPSGRRVLIEYDRPGDAYRALGILMGSVLSGGQVRPRAESSPFEELVVLLDVSRNAVMRPDVVVSLARRLALMGITGIMLYSEDTYQIQDEPYFGHARGRYTAEELRFIDAGAQRVGIEVVPCIQTLGHLGNVLKWPAFADVKDNAEVLLVDEPATYELIEKMIRAATGPLSSSKIHIGMDETFGLGGGVHRNKYGVESPMELFSRHLRRVVGLCTEMGLTPRIWSDMYFRFASATNDPYGLENVTLPDAADSIPPGVELVYWDYFHVDKDHYVRQIQRHRDLGKEPILAGGALTWLHLWAQNPASLATLEAGISAAREEGLSEVVITLWGDDGSECDFFSALPSVQGFADMAYTGRIDSSDVAINFLGSSNGSFHSWLAASDIDILEATWRPSGSESRVVHQGNPGKWILWADPVLDLADVQQVGASKAKYTRLAGRMRRMVEAGTSGDERLLFVAKLADVLAAKVELHVQLRSAYRELDFKVMRYLAEELIPTLTRGVDELRKLHRSRWHETNKTFGWEVLDRRYGGLTARLDTLKHVLLMWLADPSKPIESLETEQLPLFRGGRLARSLSHARVTTGSLTGI